MRSKNASPNRQAAITAANAKASMAPNSPSADRDSKKSISPSAGGGHRRGTQCSVTLLDEFEARQQQSRAGSLPFENFIRPQTLAIPNEQIGGVAATGAGEPGTEVRHNLLLYFYFDCYRRSLFEIESLLARLLYYTFQVDFTNVMRNSRR